MGFTSFHKSFLIVTFCSTLPLVAKLPGSSAKVQQYHRTGAAHLSQHVVICLVRKSALACTPVPEAVDVDEDAVVDVVPPHDAPDHIAGLEGVQRFLR